jgi:hypothetical protein
MGTGAMVYPIDMTPFSPFAEIEWVAVQQSAAARTVEISDEMRDALDAIGQTRR